MPFPTSPSTGDTHNEGGVQYFWDGVAWVLKGHSGPKGPPGGIIYTFSTVTVDADPGPGIMRYNNSTIGSVTYLYLDNVDITSTLMTGWFTLWDDSSSSTRGYLTLVNNSNTKSTIFAITGNVIDGSGYYKIPVSYVAGTLPTNGQQLSITFSRSGDTGSGAGFPTGGTANQFLTKNNSTDYNTGWTTLQGTAGKISVSVSSGANATIDDIMGLTTGEPTGFEDLSSTISFNNGTRTFTISGTYNIWQQGVRYSKSGSASVTIGTTAGLYYIYYDTAANLQVQTTFFTLSTQAPVAYVYWTGSTCIYLGDERHGIVLDWRTHEYLHRTRGAAYASGFAISNFTTTGSGSAAADAQLDLSGGTFFDEDMRIDIVHSNTPTANFEQDLQGPGRFPVMYRSGSIWTIDAATDYPVKYGTSRITYNLNTAGSWSTPDVSNNNYIAYWLVATNNILYPVISLMGQATDSNLEKLKSDATWASLDLSGFPSLEFRPLYRIIFQTGSYGNAVNGRLVDVLDVRAGEVRQVTSSTTGIQGIQGIQGIAGSGGGGSINFDGGSPTSTYSGGPAFDCGGVT